MPQHSASYFCEYETEFCGHKSTTCLENSAQQNDAFRE
ncbi:hypothetical protein M076_4967 [Bacteroides fragilis str. 2-F-2 |uniref:Uncharacterized protein n=1 Tax=Bacteroides fragilis str. 2-F-2 \|nr:hypothetical protein M076_4967 [Bacteroides fragilis str. 2-F-2 \